MGVSKNRGGPSKWMVKIMKNPIKMDDLGVPLFLETPKSFPGFGRGQRNSIWAIRSRELPHTTFGVLVYICLEKSAQETLATQKNCYT